MKKEKKIKTKKIVEKLVINTHKTDKKIWKAIAKKVLLPKRKRKKINISRLERIAKKLGEKKTFVVPGKVLGTGNTSIALKVSALEFSETARKKIIQAKGKTLSLTELINEKPKESNLTIII